MSPATLIFEDYHRTVIGFHGTRRKTAEAIASKKREILASHNDDDWLGHGVYFWEYAPKQAWTWAKRRYPRDEVAILGAMIRLGNCFDLLDPENATRLKKAHAEMEESAEQAGSVLPTNVRGKKHLDCAVFEYAATRLEQDGLGELDTVRAVYVPTEGKRRLWPSSWLYHETHIQLSVRNPKCILGIWLEIPQQP